MTVTATFAGANLVYDDIHGCWRRPGQRQCDRCGEIITGRNVPDACCGLVPGLSAACCGHGVTLPSMQFTDHETFLQVCRFLRRRAADMGLGE